MKWVTVEQEYYQGIPLRFFHPGNIAAPFCLHGVSGLENSNGLDGKTKLDKYHLLILDDLAYVTKDQAETSVLFELIGARYERRSLLVTANQPFGEWGKIFPDQAMTLAVVDRLVHHATIFEMNVESYRRRTALDRKRGPGRPPVRATIAANA